jgi:hypothetical protein
MSDGGFIWANNEQIFARANTKARGASSHSPCVQERLAKVPRDAKCFQELRQIEREGLRCTLKLGGLLALQFPQSKHWGFSSATDPIPLPEPKPRALGERLIVPSIRSREVTLAQRSDVRHRVSALQPLDFGNGLLSVHLSQYLRRGR